MVNTDVLSTQSLYFLPSRSVSAHQYTGRAWKHHCPDSLIETSRGVLSNVCIHVCIHVGIHVNFKTVSELGHSYCKYLVSDAVLVIYYMSLASPSHRN